MSGDWLWWDSFNPSIDPGDEPDPLTCKCQVKEPGRGGVLETQSCDWFRFHDYHSTLKPQRTAHQRQAFNWQAAGYKGPQHYRSVEQAARERDKRTGRQ
jgi:hypothetical protein